MSGHPVGVHAIRQPPAQVLEALRRIAVEQLASVPDGLHAGLEAAARAAQAGREPISLVARRDQDNALMALRHLGADEAACEAAVTRAEWPARMQRLTEGTLAERARPAELWLDGGHNPGAGAA